MAVQLYTLRLVMIAALRGESRNLHDAVNRAYGQFMNERVHLDDTPHLDTGAGFQFLKKTLRFLRMDEYLAGDGIREVGQGKTHDGALIPDIPALRRNHLAADHHPVVLRQDIRDRHRVLFDLSAEKHVRIVRGARAS